jgi:serine protease
LPEVLYANLVPTARATGTSAADLNAAGPSRRPSPRLIVKFRDPDHFRAAKRNEPLSRTLLDRLSARGGRPVAYERTMSGGAYVVRLLQVAARGRGTALVACLRATRRLNIVEPDIWVQPQLAPNDLRYPEQWDYMSPPGQIGGVNLPPAWDITTGSPESSLP